MRIRQKIRVYHITVEIREECRGKKWEKTCCFQPAATRGPSVQKVPVWPLCPSLLNTWSKGYFLGILPKPCGAYNNDMEIMILISALWFAGGWGGVFLKYQEKKKSHLALLNFQLCLVKGRMASLLWVQVPPGPATHSYTGVGSHMLIQQMFVRVCCVL